MQHHGRRGGVSWLVGYTIRSLSIEGETKGSTQLGETPNSEGRQIVFRVCKLLSPFYFQICRDSSSINVVDEEQCGDAMGSSSAVGVLVVEGHLVQCANASLPRPKATI